jgi:hypothetical protein
MNDLAARQRLTDRTLAVALGAILLAAYIALIAIVRPMEHDNHLYYLVFGLICGTLGSHSTLAGLYCVFGPGKWGHRVVISLGWLTILLLGFTLSRDEFYVRNSSSLWVPRGCIFLHWLATLVLCWPLRFWWRVALRRPDQIIDPQSQQLSLRQLMLLTAGFGVLLGAARLLLWEQLGGTSYSDVFYQVIGLLVLFTTLRLVFAILAEQSWQWRTSVVLALMMCLPLAAGPILKPLFVKTLIWYLLEDARFARLRPIWSQNIFLLLYAIQLWQVFWVLLVCGLVRYSGYRFVSQCQRK